MDHVLHAHLMLNHVLDLLLINVNQDITSLINISPITLVMLVELEQQLVQVTPLPSLVYLDLDYLQVVLVLNVEPEQVHVLFQEVQQLLLHVMLHSKMSPMEHVHVPQDKLHLLMEVLVLHVQLIVLYVHLPLNVLHVILLML